MPTTNPTAARRAYLRLLARFNRATPAQSEESWRLLMAAHVVGQHELTLHWDSHVRMLGLARRTRDWREAGGQLLRLALVPLGHAIGRLPAGNIGRATVSALRPMEPPQDVRALVAWSLRGA